MSWVTRYFAEADKSRAEELEKAEREAIASGKEPFDLPKFEQLLNRGPQDKRVADHRYSYYISHAEFRTLAEYAAYLLDNEPWLAPLHQWSGVVAVDGWRAKTTKR